MQESKLNGDTLIFSGNSNTRLAEQIAKHLNTSLGNIDVSQFSDGEVDVQINEHVRGHHVYVVQSTCEPTNTNLVELLVMVDAFRRSAVQSITTVIPYYGYSRQDRRPDFTRSPISSRLVADLLQAAGVDQVITMDIHSGQQQGFFSIPMINMPTIKLMVDHIQENYGTMPVIVSPDVGGVQRARTIAKHLDTDLAIIDKRRPKSNQSEVMNIIGQVTDRNCVIVDDIIDTAGTLCRAATALKQNGNAQTVSAYATHPVFSGKAFRNIEESQLDSIVVTDTIPWDDNIPSRIRTISVSQLLAETLKRIRHNESISKLC